MMDRCSKCGRIMFDHELDDGVCIYCRGIVKYDKDL